METLLIKYISEQRNFICRSIENPNYSDSSNEVFYPVIHYDAKECRRSEILIPQAKLNLSIWPNYSFTTELKFTDLESNETFSENSISGLQNRFEVAKYIKDTLNLRMAEIVQKEDKIDNLSTIIDLKLANNKLIAENQELVSKNQNLEQKLTQITHILTGEVKESV